MRGTLSKVRAATNATNKSADYSGIHRGRNNVPDGACEGRGNDRDGEEKHSEEGCAHCVSDYQSVDRNWEVER